MRLGFGWGLDKMMTLAEPSVLDLGKKKILGDNVVLPLDWCWVDSVSKKNWGDFSTQDYMFQNMAHWTAFESC
jgi:hypothetical protein